MNISKFFVVLAVTISCCCAYAMDDDGRDIRESLDPFPCDMMAVPSEHLIDSVYNAFLSAGFSDNFRAIRLPISARFLWLGRGCVQVKTLLNPHVSDFSPRFIELKTNGVFKITCCDCELRSKVSFYEHLDRHRHLDRRLHRESPHLQEYQAEIVFSIASSSGLIEQFLKRVGEEPALMTHQNNM